jgi:hypothetical protein
VRRTRLQAGQQLVAAAGRANRQVAPEADRDLADCEGSERIAASL